LLEDAIERLSLYVGPGNEITEEAITDSLKLVRPATVWELVSAVGRRDPAAALSTLGKVYEAQDRGLRLLGVLAWSTRQLIHFASATREGLGPAEAAKRAGVPPFKANELSAQLKGLTPRTLSSWVTTLSTLDLELKGGSKRPPRATLEHAVLSLCQEGTL
jgi:DNA polymerase-3 subunit delta